MKWAWALLLALPPAGCKRYDLSNPEQQVAAGKQYVAHRRCPSCHQSSNPADGILSGQTTPQAGSMAYGSNLTPDVASGLGGWADIEIVRALRAGVDNQQRPLCPTMPRFDGSQPSAGKAMGDGEADAIVAYLRSLPAVARAIPESICPPIEPPVGADMAAPVVDLGGAVDLAGVDDLAAPAPDLAGDDGGSP